MARRIHALVKLYLNTQEKKAVSHEKVLSLIYKIDSTATKKMGIPIFFSQYTKQHNRYIPITTINLMGIIEEGLKNNSDVISPKRSFTKDEWDIVVSVVNHNNKKSNA